MYIHPFWAGVAVTILAEVEVLIVCAIVRAIRRGKQKRA